jgi:hypothetical protein
MRNRDLKFHAWAPLKGHGNEADFLGFLQKLGPHRSLTLSSRSAFGFEFAEIFVIEKRLPDSASRRLSDSASRRVAFECLKEKLGESESRLLNVQKKNWASRRVGDSPTRLMGESLTPRLSESESRRLPDFENLASTPRLGESGSRFSITNISANRKPKLERLEMQCKEPTPNRFLKKNPRKSASLPCPFRHLLATNTVGNKKMWNKENMKLKMKEVLYIKIIRVIFFRPWCSLRNCGLPLRREVC